MTNTVRLGCKLVRQVLGPYYASRLTEAWLMAVERHLLDCQDCLDEYDERGEVLDREAYSQLIF